MKIAMTFEENLLMDRFGFAARTVKEWIAQYGVEHARQMIDGKWTTGGVHGAMRETQQAFDTAFGG